MLSVLSQFHLPSVKKTVMFQWKTSLVLLMYSITYLYSTGIRGKDVSLKDTKLHLPVRSQAQKGVGLTGRMWP